MNTDNDAASHQKQIDDGSIQDQLAGIRKRLSWLTVAVFLVAVALLLFVAGVLAKEIDFHYGESKLIAGACTGGVAMGFLFGWLARRTVRFRAALLAKQFGNLDKLTPVCRFH